MGAITLEKVTKSFGDVTVIPGVDLEIADGEFVVFVGPSGCGKSTLLRMVAGLEDITGGKLLIGGEVVNAGKPAPSPHATETPLSTAGVAPSCSETCSSGCATPCYRSPLNVARAAVHDAA